MKLTSSEIRRSNLLILINEVGGNKQLADLVDTNTGYLSQILSDKTDRNVGDNLARRLESACNKERGWMDVSHFVDEENIPELQPAPKQQSLADLIEKNIINKVSPKSRDLLMLIQQAIEENRLTDDMATEIEGYLKIKLSENKSNKDKEKNFNDLKERLLKAQDDTNHGTDNDR